LLEQRLGRELRQNIAILNYGHSGYGVLQMFDLAAVKVQEHRPDLMIFAFLTDDLTRSRWWAKTIALDGFARPLLSASKDSFEPRSAADTHLINPAVDASWCRHALHGSQDSLLQDLNKQYSSIKASTLRARGITPFSLTHLYLLNRVLTGTPSQEAMLGIPRVTFDDFAADARLAREIDELNASGIPYLLVHLPLQRELLDRKMYASKQDQALLRSLERLTRRNVTFLHDILGSEQLPEKMDLLPYDTHPNFAGLDLYARLITRLLEGRLKESRLTFSSRLPDTASARH
jgi:hypothetical protein